MRNVLEKKREKGDKKQSEKNNTEKETTTLHTNTKNIVKIKATQMTEKGERKIFVIKHEGLM